ncbi:MAG TPA: DUF2007 domain-containing protein [Thermoanaerobaculia bacterium]
MLCPECGFEYEEGVVRCEVCEVPLVDEVHDEPTDFVPLAESTDVVFFSLLTSRLEEAGIPWFVQSEESLGLLPRDGRGSREPGVQVVSIYVAENRFEQAQTLAKDLDPVGALEGMDRN